VAETSVAEEVGEEASASDQKKWVQRLIKSEEPVTKSEETHGAVVGTIGPQQPRESTMTSAMNPQDLDVIELSEDASAAAILSAVLQSRASELVECPVTPPMCPGARLAVRRDHRIVLFAVARQGLAELPAIGSAFRWLTENRALIRMAVPQLAIDPAQPVQLSLLIDQSDSSAATLRPILQTGQVTVQTYRTLKWSGKRGLLLEAA
jgi:hypothetical protein